MPAEARRHELLAALGIDRYVRRAPRARAALIVVCDRAAAGGPAAARLRALLPGAVGVAASAVRWIATDGARVPPLPAARTVLVLGAALARACAAAGSGVPPDATIAVADEPATSLRGAMAKRALWQALKPIARRLRGGGD